MMKFFRKHNKKLLSVFMVLLMIVFLGGSALDTLLQPSGDRTVATTRILGPVTYRDQQAAQSTTRILTAFGIPEWQRPVPGIPEPLGLVDWILLAREAKRLGVGANEAKLRASLPNPEAVEELARRLHVKPDGIVHALAEFASVYEAALTVGAAVTPSQAEVEAAARKTLERLRVNMVMLPAEVFVDEGAELSEAELAAQFEEYRAKEPGAGLAFGYYLPTSLKVQYIKIDRDALAEHVRVPNLERKARIYYNERRERHPAFRRSEEEFKADNSDDASEGVEPEKELVGPPYEPPPYLAWGEAKEKAFEIIRRQEADEAASRLADWLLAHSAEAWLDVERGDDGYKLAPRTVADLGYYDKILENVPATIAYPGAVSPAMTAFFVREEADSVAGLGTAFFFAPQTGSPTSFQLDPIQKLGGLAFRTKATVPEVPDAKGTNPADFLAMFQTCRMPLRDSGSGDIYLFRVVDARPAHVPESIDEVRDRVVADLRLLRAYQEAMARAESLRSCEESGSLQEAYESDEDLVARIQEHALLGSGYLEPVSFARTIRYYATGGAKYTRTPIPAGVGAVSPKVAEELFALTDSLEKIKTIELRDRATVMIAEWVETEAPQYDEFDAQRKTFLDELARNRSQAAINEWLNPENIRARTGFALITN